MSDLRTAKVAPEDAKSFVEAILEGAGVSKVNAATIAHGLVSADLRGVESHGINRIPSYLARVRNGILDPKAEPTLNQITPVVAQVRAPEKTWLLDGSHGGKAVRTRTLMIR